MKPLRKRVIKRLKKKGREVRLRAGRRLSGFGGTSRVRRRLPGFGRTLDELDVCFTVTSGRTGTQYLYEVANLLHDVEAHHEPAPSFVPFMRGLAEGRDVDVVKRWLSEVKVPAIARTQAPSYLETSHIFCKGFLEPWIEVVGVPSLIVWTRDPRSIAKSLLKVGEIPGRTSVGTRWYLKIGDEGTLPVEHADSLSDYQVCYWYVLEIERRQREYSELVKAKGGRVLESNIQRLNGLDGFRELTVFLRGRVPDAYEERIFREIANRPVNTKSSLKNARARVLPEDLDAEEQELRLRIERAHGCALP